MALKFFLVCLSKLLRAPLLVYFCFFWLDLPALVRFPLYVLSTPVYSYARSIRFSRRRRLEINRLGAQEMPLWPGCLPGHVDLLPKLYNSWKNGYPGDGLDDAIDKFGPTFRSNLCGMHQVWTCDPDNVKTILVTDFDGYMKGPNFRKATMSMLGDGIFNADGDMWKFHRSITRPFFNKDQISDLTLILTHADRAIEQSKARFQQGHPVDFQHLMSSFSLDVTTAFLLGSCVDSLSAGLPYPGATGTVTSESHPANAFAHAFTNAQQKVGMRLWSGPPWPLWEVFGDITKKDVEVIYRFIDPILEKAFEKTLEHENEKSGPAINDDGDQTLLKHLIAQTDNLKLIRDEIINILIAGRDTTTSTLTCILYCLSQHPEVVVRLREEILETVGPTQVSTYHVIKSMTYMRAVINETLRLFPPVPFNARETTRPTTWPSKNPGEEPYYLATGTTITISLWHMHRDKNLWGPDALEFDPNRFLDARLQKYLTPNPSIFVPFNGGPRLCLGREFAYNQMSIFLIRLFQNFDAVSLAAYAQPAWSRPPLSWKAPENSGKRKSKEEFWPKHHLTIYAHGGLWLTMQSVGSEARDIIS